MIPIIGEGSQIRPCLICNEIGFEPLTSIMGAELLCGGKPKNKVTDPVEAHEPNPGSGASTFKWPDLAQRISKRKPSLKERPDVPPHDPDIVDLRSAS